MFRIKLSQGLKTVGLHLLSRIYRYGNNSPLLCPLIFRLHKMQGIFPKRGTHLCLEGFPRSGNSFSVALLNTHLPELDIAHHTHRVAALKLATRYSIPCIVLVRNPLDAIASNVLRGEQTTKQLRGMLIREHLFLYHEFYQYVVRNTRNFHIVSFESVVKNPGELLNLCAVILGLPDKKIDLQRVCSTAIETMNRVETQRGESALGSALPKEEKQIELQKLKKTINSSVYQGQLNKCLGVYNRLVCK